MIEPRWYQRDANAAVWKYLAETKGNPLVVLPTGAGKSLLIGLLIEQALQFSGRVVVLAHRKELLEQNAAEIRGLIPGVDVGIYSAGLKSKQIGNAVVVAGIQSVFRKAADLGKRHLVLVDEAHLISDLEEGMYRQFLSGIAELNTGLRIVGLTATPFRTGSGPICGPERVFHRIVFEAKTERLIAEGYLCPITNRISETQIDTDSVSLRGGEFIEAELQRAFQAGDCVSRACAETVQKCDGRRSILIFSSGIQHAEQIAEIIQQITGERVGVVTGETHELERSVMLSDFKSQHLRWLVNCDVLTTGFNARCVDAIAVLRATMSPGLFCQMVGRGLRLHEGKRECLLLDFGGNIKRHGSIDSDSFGRGSGRPQNSREKAAEDNGRGRECPNCKLDVSVRENTCPECGWQWPITKREVNHDGSAEQGGTITGKEPAVWYRVKDVMYKRHEKKSDPTAPPTVRIDYWAVPDAAEQLGNMNQDTVSEWVCPEHEKYARVKFEAWWDARSNLEAPGTVKETLMLLEVGAARVPAMIAVQRDGKYRRIVEVKFEADKPTELAETEERLEYSGLDDDCPF